MRSLFRKRAGWDWRHLHQWPTRVGLGFDVHRVSPDPSRKLILGGIEFVGEAGLEAHSDGDVVVHAIIDALLGAAGLGDIGDHFPDSDSHWKNASSVDLLRSSMQLLGATDWKVANVDCSVVLEKPKLAQRKAEMERVLSDVVQAHVGIKAKTAEGLGVVGRQEAIACWAVALLAVR